MANKSKKVNKKDNDFFVYTCPSLIDLVGAKNLLIVAGIILVSCAAIILSN